MSRTTRFNMKFPVLNSDPLPTEPNLKIWKKLEKTEISTQQIFNALFNYFSKLILSIEKNQIKRLNLESKFLHPKLKSPKLSML